MSCVKRGCPQECFYCDIDVTRHEHDHAPIPQRAGGVEVVTACPSCHHLKDRILYSSWQAVMAIPAMTELVEAGLVPTLATASVWPECWDDMSAHARLLWAKMAALALDGDQLGIRRVVTLVE